MELVKTVGNCSGGVWCVEKKARMPAELVVPDI